VCLRDVKNPIVLDREYDGVRTGPLEPRYEDVRYERVFVGDAPACTGRFVPFPERRLGPLDPERRPGPADPAQR
jgi:hypothetical protein